MGEIVLIDGASLAISGFGTQEGDGAARWVGGKNPDLTATTGGTGAAASIIDWLQENSLCREEASVANEERSLGLSVEMLAVRDGTDPMKQDATGCSSTVGDGK